MRYASVLAFGSLALSGLAPGAVGATALTGGVVSAVAALGACADAAQIPGDTPQDSFSLSAAAVCNGESASGTVGASAATASVGLLAQSSGNGLASSQVAAQVLFRDDWLITPTSGDIDAPSITLPATISLHGTISAAAMFHPAFGRFLDYGLAIYDKRGPLAPGGMFSARGNLDTTGSFALSWTGPLTLFNSRIPAAPFVATADMILGVPGLTEGLLDFSNTASIRLDLPAGYTAVTSSGLPLFSTPPVTPVPAPPALCLVLGGLALILALSARPCGAATACPS